MDGLVLLVIGGLGIPIGHNHRAMAEKLLDGPRRSLGVSQPCREGMTKEVGMEVGEGHVLWRPQGNCSV